ncbi:hypothetical protein E4U32_006555 [Claviceps aff. humidiphila group G2b]|nr:hypothetical protein E4U32_006555 [Claviceps aff. humidiphila group G2b]
MPDSAAGLTRLAGHTKPLAGNKPDPGAGSSSAPICFPGDSVREQQNLLVLEGIQTSRLVRLTGDGTPVGLQACNGAIRFSPHASFDTVALAANGVFSPGGGLDHLARHLGGRSNHGLKGGESLYWEFCA